jgi:hypothetical protein
MILSGGLDKSIFMYKIVPYMDYIEIEPIGLLAFSGPIQSITWKPNTVSKIN